MVKLDKHSMFYALQTTGKALQQAVADDVAILDGISLDNKKTCPFCGKRHLDTSYGRACEECWKAYFNKDIV